MLRARCTAGRSQTRESETTRRLMKDEDFVGAKPAIQSETVRGGIYEIANGLTQIVGNFLGISPAIAVINGIASIFAGVQTIKARKKANKRIEGVFASPEVYDPTNEEGV